MSTVVYRDLARRSKPVKSFEPCLPRKAKAPPSGPNWIPEIKHDGFRLLARKDGGRIKLITRNGYDFADCCRLIVDAIANLSVKSCIIDDKAIVVDQNGLSVFDLIRRYRRHDMQLPCAFDVIVPDGADLRRPFNANGGWHFGGNKICVFRGKFSRRPLNQLGPALASISIILH